MTVMENPTQCHWLSEVVCWVAGSRNMHQKDVLLLSPFLDGKVLDIDVAYRLPTLIILMADALSSKRTMGPGSANPSSLSTY